MKLVPSLTLAANGNLRSPRGSFGAHTRDWEDVTGPLHTSATHSRIYTHDFNTTAAAATSFSSASITSIISGPISCALTRSAAPRAQHRSARAVQNCAVTKWEKLRCNDLGRPERTYHAHNNYNSHYLSKPHSAVSSSSVRLEPRCASWTMSRERDEPTPLWP